MSLTAHLPRLGLFDRPMRKPKHSAPAEVDRLRGEVARLRTLLDGAHALIAGLQMREEEAEAKRGEAEELVVQQQADLTDLTTDRDTWRDEALALRARFGAQLAAEANANRVTVPAMQRIGADQETAPQGIDVTTLWEARDAGLLGPVTNPGHARGVA